MGVLPSITEGAKCCHEQEWDVLGQTGRQGAAPQGAAVMHPEIMTSMKVCCWPGGKKKLPLVAVSKCEKGWILHEE